MNKKPKFILQVHMWDWKETPDVEFFNEMSKMGCRFYSQPNTGSDSYVIMACTEELEDPQAVWDDLEVCADWCITSDSREEALKDIREEAERVRREESDEDA